MRTTVDIPDPIYRQLKTKANTEGRSVKDLILRGVVSEIEGAKRKRQGASLPIVKSKRPGTVELDNAKIFEIIPYSLM